MTKFGYWSIIEYLVLLYFFDQMEQKRKIKSLLPQKFDWKSLFLTELLLFLSIVMCVLSVSLMTSRVGAIEAMEVVNTPGSEQINNSTKFTGYQLVSGLNYFTVSDLSYTWIDNEMEVIYAMRFLDPGDLTEIINNIYMSGNNLYISPNPVVVHSRSYMEEPGQEGQADNMVWSGVYAHILWWENNKVYSNNVTLIAWEDNEVASWNDNAAVLWWVGNRFGPWKSGWVPMVSIWWYENVLWTGHDGSALIWWKNNRIWENSSSVYIFWWENNEVGDNVKNAMVWWTNVTVSGVNNIFVYSTYGNFSPLSSNAFYLNLYRGVWLGVDSNHFGIAISGAVSFWELDIRSVRCNDSNLGIVWSYQWCLVWCTVSSGDNSGGKWSLLDIGDKCLEMCEDNSSYCFLWSSFQYEVCGDDAYWDDDDIPDDEWDWGGGGSHSNHFGNINRWTLVWPWGQGKVVNREEWLKEWLKEELVIRWPEEPYAHCTTGVVSLVNAFRCDGAGVEELYSRSVVFETNLIDSDMKCPLWWENKCVFKCKSGYHLLAVDNGYKFECKSDCVMEWANGERETFKYKEETNWFKYGELNCANASECSTYMDVLVCWDDWTMYIKGSTVSADGYYKDCEMKDYKCDSTYNLSVEDIRLQYNDTIDTSNLTDRVPVEWERWIYDVCMDYDGGESCSEGDLHFKFKGCKDRYSVVNGKCMKQCEIIYNNLVPHGMSVKFYKSWDVTCPGTCSSHTFRCNDWTWEATSSWFNKNDYKYNYCALEPKTCDLDIYNITSATYNSLWGKNWEYESCNSYSTWGNACVWPDVTYRLVKCNTWYHKDNPSSSTCTFNRKLETCRDNPENSVWINGNGTYSVIWSWTWDVGEWVSDMTGACRRRCSSGYWENNWECVLISQACESMHYSCVDSHASVTNTWEDMAWYYWECEGNPCFECNTGYHPTGWWCAKDIDWVCDYDIDEPYGCKSWILSGRSEVGHPAQYDWKCLWEWSAASDDVCHKCKENAVWSGDECVCKEWYKLDSSNDCVESQELKVFVDNGCFEWNASNYYCRKIKTWFPMIVSGGISFSEFSNKENWMGKTWYYIDDKEAVDFIKHWCTITAKHDREFVDIYYLTGMENGGFVWKGLSMEYISGYMSGTFVVNHLTWPRQAFSYDCNDNWY